MKKLRFSLKNEIIHVEGKIENALHTIFYYYIKTGVINSDVNPLTFKFINYDEWYVEIDTCYGDALVNPDRDIFGMIFYRKGAKKTVEIDGKTTSVEKVFSKAEKHGIKNCIQSIYTGAMEVWNDDTESFGMTVLVNYASNKLDGF